MKVKRNKNPQKQAGDLTKYEHSRIKTNILLLNLNDSFPDNEGMRLTEKTSGIGKYP